MRTDTEMLDWLMSLLFDDGEIDERLIILAGAVMMGKTGREAINAAMDAEQ